MTGTKRLTLAFFFLGCTASALASNRQSDRAACPTIHLDAPGGPLADKHMEVQKEGTCYASSAEALISGYLKRHGKPNRPGSTILRAGQFELAMRQKSGKSFESKSFLNTGSNSFSYIKYFRENSPCSTEKVCKNSLLTDEAKDFICGNELGKNQTGTCSLKEKDLLQDALNPLNRSVSDALYDKEHQRDCLKNTLKAKVESCPKEKNLDLPEPEVELIQSEADLTSVLLKNVAGKREPVNLGIDSGLFLKDGYVAQFEKDQDGKRTKFKGDGGHEVTVSGMYFDDETNECKVELWNWWGSSCNAFAVPCHNGKLTIPLSKLGKNTSTATYFKGK